MTPEPSRDLPALFLLCQLSPLGRIRPNCLDWLGNPLSAQRPPLCPGWCEHEKFQIESPPWQYPRSPAQWTVVVWRFTCFSVNNWECVCTHRGSACTCHVCVLGPDTGPRTHEVLNRGLLKSIGLLVQSDGAPATPSLERPFPSCAPPRRPWDVELLLRFSA